MLGPMKDPSVQDKLLCPFANVFLGLHLAEAVVGALVAMGFPANAERADVPADVLAVWVFLPLAIALACRYALGLQMRGGAAGLPKTSEAVQVMPAPPDA